MKIKLLSYLLILSFVFISCDDDSDAEFQYNKQKNQYSDFYSALKEDNDYFDMPDELELEKLSTAVEEESRKRDIASETAYMRKLRL